MSNKKILSDHDLDFLESKYTITYNKESNMLFVSLNTCNKCTVHDLNKKLTMTVLSGCSVKRMTFSKEMIDLWMQLNESGDVQCSLFKMHQITTKLYLTYQDITLKNVKNLLNRGTTKIKEIQEDRK